MPRVYIQYQTNSAVPILTQNLSSVLQGEEPVVGDLIAAFFPNTAPNELGQYTLYSINNGVETRYNSWDLLSVLGENGTGPNPLIIRSSNDQGIYLHNNYRSYFF